MALTLYGAARSRAIRNIWMAHELGVSFDHVPVIVPDAKKPEYVALNPNGHIPFLVDDGVVIFESLAINLHLARKFGGPLAPAGVMEEGLATMWTLWAVTELEPHAAASMYHTAVLPAPERKPEVRAAALAALAAPLAVLEAAIAKGGGHLLGGRFTVADLNLAGVVFYLRFNPQLLEDKPAITAWYAAATSRAAYVSAFALRGD
jgi:glutathione S-transferase